MFEKEMNSLMMMVMKVMMMRRKATRLIVHHVPLCAYLYGLSYVGERGLGIGNFNRFVCRWGERERERETFLLVRCQTSSAEKLRCHPCTPWTGNSVQPGLAVRMREFCSSSFGLVVRGL